MILPPAASRGARVLRTCGIALILAPCVAVIVLVLLHAEDLRQFFADFGADLPALTAFTYDWYLCTLAFLLLIVPVVILTSGTPSSRGRTVLVALVLVVGLLVYLLWLAAMGIGLYLPFYKLAQIQ